MATNYNITMRQFNGTDYDTLYPAANLSNSIGKIQASQVEGLSITPDMGDATGTLAVSHGGTGRTSLTSGYYLVGNGTGQVTLQSPSQLQSSLGLDQYAKIQTGSYTGTGTYGSSNPNSLTFDKPPAFLQIQAGSNVLLISSDSGIVYHDTWAFVGLKGVGGAWDDGYDIITNGSDSQNTGVYGNRIFHYTLSGTVTWYMSTMQQGSANARVQLNQSGTKYKYIAIL